MLSANMLCSVVMLLTTWLPESPESIELLEVNKPVVKSVISKLITMTEL